MTLYLLPNLLSLDPPPSPLDEVQRGFLESLAPVMGSLDGLIAESEGEGRRYLKRFRLKKAPYALPIALWNKKSTRQELDFILEPMKKKGETWGLVADRGLPCIADPGAELVLRAQALKLHIHALFGPSSLFLALMLSGLSGQQFFFHGYPPQEPAARQRALREWEAMTGVTHLFIEAPYRSQHTFLACLKTLHKETRLCVACDLLSPHQLVQTARVGEWEEREWGKRPMIFLFYASPKKR